MRIREYIQVKPSGVPFTPIKYGLLYNWYAATDVRGISSSVDWVVPTQAQIDGLVTYLGGSTIAGGKLKDKGFVFWTTPNTGATNEVGFNARASGGRAYNGTYFDLLSVFYTWATNTLTIGNNLGITVTNTSDDVTFTWGYYSENSLKDATVIRLLYTGSGSPTTYTGNDGKIYPVVLIGTQRWIAINLAETRFRNGDYLHGYEAGVYTPISNANWAALTTEGVCVYNDDLGYL